MMPVETVAIEAMSRRTRKKRAKAFKRRLEEIAERLLLRIALRFGVSVTSIKSRSRRENLVEARRQFCKIMRRLGMSLARIGSHINRDHTTVMHALSKGSPFRCKARFYRRVLLDPEASKSARSIAQRWAADGWLWL